MDANQIQSLWVSAGGPVHLKVVMSAIAMAESGGRVNAWNRWDAHNGSSGLWQINGIHGFNGWRLRHDPAYNAHAALYVYRQEGITAWSTYQDGSYAAYLRSARLAAGHDSRYAHHRLTARHQKVQVAHHTLHVRHHHHHPVQVAAINPLTVCCAITGMFCMTKKRWSQKSSNLLGGNHT